MYSLVVPVFNSAESLPELCRRLESVFKTGSLCYELILVDDCSQDESWEVMRSIRKRDPCVSIIRLMRNYGQHNALMCGFAHVKGEFVITLDDDLQNPPEEIFHMIDEMAATGADVVFGLPRRRAHSTVRNLGSRFYIWLLTLSTGKKIDFRLSNFRLIKRNVVDHLLKINTPNPTVGLLILTITEKVGMVEVEHQRRLYGKTNYNRAKLAKHFFHGILYNSLLLLKLVWFSGIGCLALSFVLSIYYLIKHLVGAISVSGFTTIVLLILFFSGINMFAVGIIGEYLFRIIQEVRRMPSYTIREREIGTEPCKKLP